MLTIIDVETGTVKFDDTLKSLAPGQVLLKNCTQAFIQFLTGSAQAGKNIENFGNTTDHAQKVAKPLFQQNGSDRRDQLEKLKYADPLLHGEIKAKLEQLATGEKLQRPVSAKVPLATTTPKPVTNGGCGPVIQGQDGGCLCRPSETEVTTALKNAMDQMAETKPAKTAKAAKQASPKLAVPEDTEFLDMLRSAVINSKSVNPAGGQIPITHIKVGALLYAEFGTDTAFSAGEALAVFKDRVDVGRGVVCRIFNNSDILVNGGGHLANSKYKVSKSFAKVFEKIITANYGGLS